MGFGGKVFWGFLSNKTRLECIVKSTATVNATVKPNT